jgi:hypothetical protein
MVISVLATGPKGRVFKPGWVDGCLRAIQILGMVSKAGGCML